MLSSPPDAQPHPIPSSSRLGCGPSNKIIARQPRKRGLHQLSENPSIDFERGFRRRSILKLAKSTETTIEARQQGIELLGRTENFLMNSERCWQLGLIVSDLR